MVAGVCCCAEIELKSEIPVDFLSFAPLKVQPTDVTAWRLLLCGKIAVIVGWCSAGTIGSTFGRIYCSDIESYWARQMPSLPALLSTPTSRSDAMSAAKSISINRQKC